MAKTVVSETKNKGGRPAKVLTDEQVVQVEALAAFLTLEQVADYFGIGRTTFHSIMKRQPEVSERYKKGRMKAVVSVGKSLIDQAREGNTTAIIFYLKTQGGWKETQSVDLTLANEDKPKVYKSLKELFDDDDDTE